MSRLSTNYSQEYNIKKAIDSDGDIATLSDFITKDYDIAEVYFKIETSTPNTLTRLTAIFQTSPDGMDSWNDHPGKLSIADFTVNNVYRLVPVLGQSISNALGNFARVKMFLEGSGMVDLKIKVSVFLKGF